MSRVVVVFIALAVLAMVGVSAYDASLAEAGEDFIVTNETFTPDSGNVTNLSESNRGGVYYSDNATVYDENHTRMDYGTDYVWFTDNGTIKTLSGGGLDGDSNATVSYEYQVTTESQRDLTALLGQVPRVFGFALPFGALLFLLYLAGGA